MWTVNKFIKYKDTSVQRLSILSHRLKMYKMTIAVKTKKLCFSANYLSHILNYTKSGSSIKNNSMVAAITCILTILNNMQVPNQILTMY